MHVSPLTHPKGDIDAPSSPPCSRCKRESRECVFAPSRRGGNHNKKNDAYGASIQDLIYPQNYPTAGPSTRQTAPSTSPLRSPSPKRRRLRLNPPVQASDPSSFVVADIQNESDALQILALASGHAGGSAETRQGTGNLNDFPLVRLGIVDTVQLSTLSQAFFQHHHHFFVSVTFLVGIDLQLIAANNPSGEDSANQ